MNVAEWVADRLGVSVTAGASSLAGIIAMLGWGTYSVLAWEPARVAGAQVSPTAEAEQRYSEDCRTFPETAHTVCGRFLQYWDENGGLAQQGYPLSEEFTETGSLDGKPYAVQYFERAVFELHPDNKAPYDVLLSQLGTFVARDKYVQGFPSGRGEVPFYEDRTQPVAVLLSYYNAINRKEYERAYSYFQGSPNPDPALAASYAQWARGYESTTDVTVSTGKVTQDARAGNIYASFPVFLSAKQSNSTILIFAGCYTMHRVNTGIPDNPRDELWSISAANLRIIPDKPDVDAILAENCAR